MSVTPDIAFGRMLSRFIKKVGSFRLIISTTLAQNQVPYIKLKRGVGIADGYAEIDNNGAFGADKPVLDISGTNPLVGSRFNPFVGGQRAVEGIEANINRQPGYDWKMLP